MTSPMVVVSNTSPLSNLAIIGRLGLLREQFGELFVPKGVYDELGDLRHADARTSLTAAFEERWIKQERLTEPPARWLSNGLHPGESEALALALRKNAGLVLLDDGDARKRAAAAGLRVTGVLGILLKGKQMGRIDSMRDEILRLRKEARFFIAPALERQIIEAAGE